MAQQPNIVWVFLDQCRADVLGCYGHPFIRTPNLDRLAASGVLFEDAYCQSPVCVPSRVSMLSGMYCNRTGVFHNSDAMRPEDSLLLNSFRDAGYRTASIGKVHLGISPQDAGFDEHHEIRHDGIPHMCVPDDYPADWPWRRFDVDGFPKPVIYATDMCPRERTYCAVGVDDAIGIFERHDHVRQPLLLRLSLDRPHTPVSSPKPFDRMYLAQAELPEVTEAELAAQPTPVRAFHEARRWGEYTDEEILNIRAYYYGLVTHLDDELGRLFDAIAASPQAGNTVLALTCDHGCMLGEHGQYVKGCHYYRQTARVPFMLAWPGRLPADQRVGSLVQMVDLLPTLCELAGVPAPDRAQGRSLLPVIQGESEGRDIVFAEMGKGDALFQAVRTTRYAYTRYPNIGEASLFDLDADPKERVDLMQEGTTSAVARELEQRLETILEECRSA